MPTRPDGGQEVKRFLPPDQSTEREGWILRLFGLPRRFGFRRSSVPLVAAAISLGLLALGGLVTAVLHAVGSFDGELLYHTNLVFYFYTLWIFFLLWLVGHWSHRYLLLWETLRPAFDASDEQYDEVVDRGLSFVYRLDIPLALFVPALVVIELVSPFSIAAWAPVPETLVSEGFQVVINFLHAVVVYLLVVHVLLVRRVSSFELSGIYSAAAELEPLAEFSASLSVKYFANIAIYFVPLYFVLNVDLAQVATGADLLRARGLTGGELVLPLTVSASYVLVGLFVFFLPMQVLHDRVRIGQRDRLVRIGREHDALFERTLADAGDGASGISERIAELNRIRDLTKGIRTWPFQLPSLLKIAISTLLPVVLYALDVLRDVWL